MTVAASSRARTLATDLLEYVPGAFCSVMRRRHPEWFLVDGHTDLVLEGYQGCGNTFARKALEHANPTVRVASHSHSWANIARGLRLGKPVVVLLRPPLDAVASHAVRMRLDDLDRELRRYRQFYRRVGALAGAAGPAGGADALPGVVLAPFEVTVNRFCEVIGQVNARFSTRFNLFDHTDPVAVAAVFDEMEREALSSPLELDRLWRIARPSAEREEATRAMRARLAGERHRPALARCDAVYQALLRAC